MGVTSEFWVEITIIVVVIAFAVLLVVAARFLARAVDARRRGPGRRDAGEDSSSNAESFAWDDQNGNGNDGGDGD